MHGDLHLFNIINSNSMQYNLLIHWFDTYLQVLSQQVSSFNCVQLLDWLGSAQQTGQNMLKCGIHFAYNDLYIHSVWILYTNCIHNFLWCILFVDQNWCIQNVYKMFPTFQQTFVYILYTKFSCNSSFNFVYKMYI